MQKHKHYLFTTGFARGVSIIGEVLTSRKVLGVLFSYQPSAEEDASKIETDSATEEQCKYTRNVLLSIL